eukprot:8306813-Alexandrium_andersonii.AAC.1
MPARTPQPHLVQLGAVLAGLADRVPRLAGLRCGEAQVRSRHWQLHVVDHGEGRSLDQRQGLGGSA